MGGGGYDKGKRKRNREQLNMVGNWEKLRHISIQSIRTYNKVLRTLGVQHLTLFLPILTVLREKNKFWEIGWEEKFLGIYSSK